MNEITCLKYYDESVPKEERIVRVNTAPKPAKMSEDKTINTKNKRNSLAKSDVSLKGYQSVNANDVSVQNVQSTAATEIANPTVVSNTIPVQNTNQLNASTVTMQTPIEPTQPVLQDNNVSSIDQTSARTVMVAQTQNVHIYRTKEQSIAKIVGAKKLRAGQKITLKKKSSELRNQIGEEEFATVGLNIKNENKLVSDINSNINEVPKVQDSSVSSSVSPSVDDYFNKRGSITDMNTSIQGKVDRISNIKIGCEELDMKIEQAVQEIERESKALDQEEMEWTMIFEKKQAELLRKLAELDAIKKAKSENNNEGMRLAG